MKVENSVLCFGGCFCIEDFQNFKLNPTKNKFHILGIVSMNTRCSVYNDGQTNGIHNFKNLK